MDKTVKHRWVTALRSGRYKQGQNFLRPTQRRYCCLGVLCDLENPKGWNTPEKKGNVYSFESGRDECDLPIGLVSRIDMTLSQMNELISMNDSGKSFAEIADYIEREL